MGCVIWVARARCRGTPSSDVTVAASSSARSCSASPIAAMYLPRSVGEVALHDGKASRAAATARSASSRDPPATSAITSSVAGLTTGIVDADLDSIHLPPTKFFVSLFCAIVPSLRLASPWHRIRADDPQSERLLGRQQAPCSRSPELAADVPVGSDVKELSPGSRDGPSLGREGLGECLHHLNVLAQRVGGEIRAESEQGGNQLERMPYPAASHPRLDGVRGIHE